MTLLYMDNRFLNHQTGSHPECGDRLTAITRHLGQTGLVGRCQSPSWQRADELQLRRVHDPSLIDAIQRIAEQGGGQLDSDTVMSAASYDVAALAAGAALDATRRVVAGEDRSALCLVRPPGHHALRSRAMGFCLFNNVAVAAQFAVDEFELERVLIVDWDVHHGNGTQAIFYDDPRIGYLSIHRWPFYPGTGAADETGRGEGLGATRNLPTKFGASRQDQLAQFASELRDFADRIRPQLVLISAGFDSHREDPIGSLGLEVEDFAILTQTVQEVADSHASGRIVSLLEGGYHPQRLAECVAAHLTELLAARQ